MKLYVSIQTQCGYCDGKGFVESTTRVACGYCNGIGRHTVPVEMSKLAEFIQNLFRLRIRSALQIMEEIYWKEWKS